MQIEIGAVLAGVLTLLITTTAQLVVAVRTRKTLSRTEAVSTENKEISTQNSQSLQVIHEQGVAAVNVAAAATEAATTAMEVAALPAPWKCSRFESSCDERLRRIEARLDEAVGLIQKKKEPPHDAEKKADA